MRAWHRNTGVVLPTTCVTSDCLPKPSVLLLPRANEVQYGAYSEGYGED